MSNMKNRLVYWNGEFVQESEARVSIYDSSLMFGDMVFEMTRSFKGAQWKLREHLERLYTGIKILRIPIEMTIDEMERAVYDTIEINKPAFNEDDEHRVLIDVSRGLLSLYHDIPGLKKGPNIIIADFPLKWTIKGSSHLYNKGVNMIIPSQRAIPAHLMEPKIKNRSRLFYLMANIEVSLAEGNDNWALLLDPDGFVAEGTGSNFFLVKNNKLYTPQARNILRGITRQSIIDDIAPRLGIEVFEKNLELYDVYEADEAFFTSTPFCVLPAVSINGIKIGNGQPGIITNGLLKSWSDLVGVDIVKQIQDWDNNTNIDLNAPTPYKFKTKSNTTLTMDIKKEK